MTGGRVATLAVLSLPISSKKYCCWYNIPDVVFHHTGYVVAMVLQGPFHVYHIYQNESDPRISIVVRRQISHHRTKKRQHLWEGFGYRGWKIVVILAHQSCFCNELIDFSSQDRRQCICVTHTVPRMHCYTQIKGHAIKTVYNIHAWSLVY